MPSNSHDKGSKIRRIILGFRVENYFAVVVRHIAVPCSELIEATEATTIAPRSLELCLQFLRPGTDWVAVKELNLNYYIGKPYQLLYIPIMVT